MGNALLQRVIGDKSSCQTIDPTPFVSKVEKTLQASLRAFRQPAPTSAIGTDDKGTGIAISRA
jgi:hypothetical protein